MLLNVLVQHYYMSLYGVCAETYTLQRGLLECGLVYIACVLYQNDLIR